MRCWPPWKDYHMGPIVILGWQTVGESWATFTLLNIIMYNWHNIFSCQFSRNCESIACIIFGKVRMWMKMSKKFLLRNCWLLQIFFIFSVRLSLISLDYFLGREYSVSRRGAVQHPAVYVWGPVKNLYKIYFSYWKSAHFFSSLEHRKYIVL